MTAKRRLVVIIFVTALLVDAMLLLTVLRARHWARLGYAGLTYIEENAAGRTQTAMFGLKPGQVMITYPGAPADRAGMRRGDRIVSIDGVSLTDAAGLARLDDRVRTGTRVVYRLERGGKRFDVPVTFESPMRNPFVIAFAVVNTVVAAAFLAIGFIVFARKGDDRRVIVFFAMVVVGALMLLGSMLAGLEGKGLRGVVATPSGSLPAVAAMAFFWFAFLPLTLHLALIFPHDRPILARHPRLLQWVYGIPTLAVALVLFTTAIGMASQTPGVPPRYAERILTVTTIVLGVIGCAGALWLGYRSRRDGLLRAAGSRPAAALVTGLGVLLALVWAFASLKWRAAAAVVGVLVVILPLGASAAFPVFACVALYRSYRDAGIEERRQVKWPLWGTFTALATKIVFSVAFYAGMVAIMVGRRDLYSWMRAAQVAQLIPTVLYLLIPISFAHAILKYRLMDIDVIVKKTVAYTILSGLIVVLYVLLVGGLGSLLVGAAGLKNQTMVIGSTIIVALLFVPLRNRLQRLVDRNLFRQKYDYPAALRALASETLAAADLRTFLAAAAETLQQATQNRGVVMLDRRQEELVASAKVGLPDSVLGTIRVPAADAVAVDRLLDPRRRQLPGTLATALRRIGAALVVPVRSQGTLHGLIALATKLSDRDYDVEDVDFLTSAADQIAIGIDRIRLQRDEEDFDQARRIQQALLPATAPAIRGLDVAGTWQPARTVGGDYYDLLPLSPTELAVCIADVAGKGMPAALLMSALQAAVRASAGAGVAPREICERVRRVIVPTLAGGRFITFFYCAIDTGARQLRYCNAGHNPPVLVRADGTVVRLAGGGPALSRLFTEAFQQSEVELIQGDALVLFTDGVSEARDAAGDDFGEPRLEALVAASRQASARDLIATIAGAVSAFSGGRVEDDLTLVAVRAE